MKYSLFIFLMACVSCNKYTVRKPEKNTASNKKFDSINYAIEIGLSDEDSLLYSEVVVDYGNYWETSISKNLKKQVQFDLYSEKIFINIKKNDDENFDRNKISDFVISCDRDTINPYLIKGMYGFIEKDTLLYWNYNPETKELRDEKGLYYKRMIIKD